MNTVSPIYFNKEHEDFSFFKQIILEQGEMTCRDNLDRTYIQSCLNKFTDGFILLGNRSKVGKFVRSKIDKYILKAYCLFEFDDHWSEVRGLILCGHTNYRTSGVTILRCVSEFIKEYKIHKWTIYSLPFDGLFQYYIDYGFNVIDVKYTRDGKKKVIVMVQNFSYDSEEQEQDEEQSECGI